MGAQLEERVWKDPRTGARVFVEERSDAWRFHGLRYRGKPRTVDFSKEPLDNGKTHTQDEWVAMLKGSPWALPDAHAVYAAFLAFTVCRGPYDREQWNAEERTGERVRYALEKSRVPYPLVTSSRLMLRPSRSELHHGYGQKHFFTKKMPFAHDCFESLTRSLLGAESAKQAELAIQWAAGPVFYEHLPYYRGFPHDEPRTHSELAVEFWIDDVMATPLERKGVAHGIRFL